MYRQLKKIRLLLDRRDHARLALLALMLLINASLEAVGVGLILPFIQLTNDLSQLHEIRGIALIYDIFGFTSQKIFLAALGISFFALVLLKNGCYLVSTAYQTRFLTGKAAETAHRLFAGYMRSPWIRITRRNSSELINVVENAASWVFQTVVPAYVTLVAEGLVVLGITAVMVAAEPGITSIAASVLGLLFAVLYLTIRRRATYLGQRVQGIAAGRLQALQQGLGTAKETRVFGRESFFLDNFLHHAREAVDATTKLIILQAAPRLIVEILVMGGIVLVVALVLADNRPTSEITAVLGLFAVGAFRIMPSMNRLLMALHNIRYGDAALGAVHDDLLGCGELSRHGGAAIPSLAKAITVENVVFAYPDSDPILHEVSITISRGVSIGFVGASGAGKSTLIDLILGILHPQSGSVCVDGVDIQGDTRSWQDQIGYIPQAITLIDDTIRRNVAFGIKEESIDGAAVERALQMAQLEGFVASLPQGTNTMVGERGVRLSGGQRQRIGIARALYHDPQVLVMDEATSALDGETEQEINRAIDGLRGRKTLLIIAHRLSTVKHCDVIVVMKNGKIIDSGSFSDLSARCADFRRMVEVAEVRSAGGDALCG